MQRQTGDALGRYLQNQNLGLIGDLLSAEVGLLERLLLDHVQNIHTSLFSLRIEAAPFESSSSSTASFSTLVSLHPWMDLIVSRLYITFMISFEITDCPVGTTTNVREAEMTTGAVWAVMQYVTGSKLVIQKV